MPAPPKRILLPTDGSDRVQRAVEHGLSLAKLASGRVTALYVLDVRAFVAPPGGAEWGPVKGLLEKEGEAALEAVRSAGDKAGVPVKTKLVVGHPSEEILKESKNHDMVVMGTLGRSGLSHLLLGSVSEKVIRHASCPVMVVPLRNTE